MTSIQKAQDGSCNVFSGCPVGDNGRWDCLPFKTAAYFIILVDNELTITYINKTLEGYNDSDVIGKDVLSFVATSQQEDFSRAIKSTMATRVQSDFNLLAYDTFGNKHYYRVGIGPIIINDTVVGASLIAAETTGEMEKIAKLEARKKEVEETYRSSVMGEFSTTLSHELRQPLSAILNYSNGIMRRLEKSNQDPSLQRALKDINENAKRASDIIGELKSFISESHSRKEVVGLDDIVKSSVEYTQLNYARARISMEIDVVSRCFKFNGSKNLLEQIFINLINNAIEAQGEEKAKVMVALQESGEDFVIRVADNGNGVPDACRDKIFTPFFTTKKAGTGLGLSICKSIIEDHDGSLSYEWIAENEPFCSTFVVRLPKPADKDNEG